VVAQELPKSPEVGDGAIVNLQIRDLTYLNRLAEAEGGHLPIEIDFRTEYGIDLPCLPFDGGDEYTSYLTILPADVLARVYQTYGSRLLEQNVRAFLQFTGKINRGIRETIQKEPEMFFAYNNGIAATAESVVVGMGRNGERVIVSVRDLQIVNGGQTTASIFHTVRRDGAQAAIASVAVPVKLTVVRKPERFGEVVSRIARYANSQNKVTEADLSSNSPFNIELERLSRMTWASARAGETSQTHWFFERARGQYKNELGRAGHTPARRKAYEKQNPRNQKFDKEEVARFIFSWDGRPWLVVRGRQKSYAEFIRGLKGKIPDRMYFEDLIARAIAFKTAENIYGTKNQAHVIGDLRYIVVPYALSWLNESLAREGYRIDLWRIWKAQELSTALTVVVRGMLEETDRLVRTLSQQHGGLIGEWAKKEEAWEQIRVLKPSVDLSSIHDDLESPERLRPHYGKGETEELERRYEEERILALPPEIWDRLYEWAKPRFPVPEGAVDLLWNVTARVRGGNGQLSEAERKRAIVVLDLALAEAKDMFADIDEIFDRLEKERIKKKELSTVLTVEDAKSILRWEKKNCRLSEYELGILKGVRDGRMSLETEKYRSALLKVAEKAQSYGFGDDDEDD